MDVVMDTPWLLVFLGLIIGLVIRNAWYTYRKVSKEGKKFDWSYVVTAIVTAIVTAAGLMSGADHIVIPDYMVEKGWWALLSMGFMIGVGGNDVLNAILKLVKKEKSIEETVEETVKELEELKEEG